MPIDLSRISPSNSWGTSGSVLSSIGTVTTDQDALAAAQAADGSGKSPSPFAAILEDVLNSANGGTGTALAALGQTQALLDSGVSNFDVSNFDAPANGAASDNAVQFIAEHEGFSSTAYRGADVQNLTIGYGHVIEPGENLPPLTQEQAMELLKSDLKPFVESVNNEFAGVNLTQNQKDALVSFSYNLGANIWSKTPKLVSDIKSGASAETLREDFARCDNCNGSELTGLLNRRLDEWKLFES